MKIECLFLGKTKESFLSDGINEYAKRLKYYTTLSIRLIKSKLKGRLDDNRIKEREGELLLDNVAKNSYLVVLDPGGKQLSSEGLADQITAWERQERNTITFLIGGPLGLSKNVLQKADMVLSLSRLTFTHDMSRLLLLEQLYRAYTIKRGEKYHK